MRVALLAGLALMLAGSAMAQPPAPAPAPAPALARIRNVLVIYAENRSFDHLYGLFPGARGIADASAEQATQLDHDGSPLPFLVVWQGDKPHPRFPRMPNAPFRIDAPPVNGGMDEVLISPVHAFFHNAEQINGGRNNMFAAVSNVGGWVMGHVDGSRLRLWQWAREFTLADGFFMGAFGGSFLNHQYLICACAPRWPDAPAGLRAQLDAQGRMLRQPGSPSAAQGPVRIQGNTQVTPDGFAVNTTQPPYQPSGVPADPANPELADMASSAGGGPAMPPLSSPTIGDRLSAAGVDWAWYAGAWREAQADAPKPLKERRVIYVRGGANFQPHHQPFTYYARFAPGTADRARHLRDGAELLADIDAGTLPPVAFYKPTGAVNQHPSYTDLVAGDAHIADILARIRGNAALWDGMLVIVTYDENGGFWDHMPPPSGPGRGDRWGPGTRIPAIIVSPFARRGHVEHTAYDTGAILRLLNRRFGLAPLDGLRTGLGDLTETLVAE